MPAPRAYRWKDLLPHTIDYLAPLMKLNAHDQAVYLYLVRHSRIAGRRQCHVVLRELARFLRLHGQNTKQCLNRLRHRGCVRPLKSDQTGVTLEVLLPHEVVCWVRRAGFKRISHLGVLSAQRLYRMRRSMLAAQGNACFYCLRRTTPDRAVMDHVVPLASGGDPGFLNMVASCRECNYRKKTHSAPHFIRMLYREGMLTRDECKNRLAALRVLRRTYSAFLSDPASGFANYTRWGGRVPRHLRRKARFDRRRV